MAYLDFEEFPDLIKYHTTIINGRLLKEEYTAIKECTLLKDIKHFMYHTQPYFLDNTPNQILYIMSTLLSWSKFLHYYWSISYPIQFPNHRTQRYNTIELLPNISQLMCETKTFPIHTITTTTVLWGDVTSHA